MAAKQMMRENKAEIFSERPDLRVDAFLQLLEEEDLDAKFRRMCLNGNRS